MAAFSTELFRVDPALVESLLDPELERNDATSVWLRSLGDLELVGLWSTLPNATPEGTLMSEILATGESMVVSLPSDFLASMAQLSDGQIQTIAQNWNKMDELEAWQASHLMDIIVQIRTLIRDARANNQIVVQLMEM